MSGEGGMGGSGEEKRKRRSTFRTLFPPVLRCLDNYIDENKRARIVIFKKRARKVKIQHV